MVAGELDMLVASRVNVCILIATAVHFRTFLITLAHGGGKGHCVSLSGVEETAGAGSAQAQGDGRTARDDKEQGAQGEKETEKNKGE